MTLPTPCDVLAALRAPGPTVPLPAHPPAPEYRMRIDTDLVYDRDEGTVSVTDGAIREVIKVRANLVDAYLRQAVIIELERLGYTVITPEPPA